MTYPWNKGKKGLQTAWNKGLSKKTNKSVLQASITKTGKKRSETQREYMSLKSGTRGKDPWNKGKVGVMKAWNKGVSPHPESIRKQRLKLKSYYKTHNVWNKGTIGKVISWAKGITGEEWHKHYPNGQNLRPKIAGTFKHSLETRKRMSEYAKSISRHPPLPTENSRLSSSMRMKQNRMDPVFNERMFKSMERSVTKPHIKVQQWLKENTSLKTLTNYCFMMGSRGASIDEADPISKIAIYVDGDYWHNLPNRQQWDNACTTFLQNRGWKVLRIWEHDINQRPDEVIERIKNLEGKENEK